MNCPGMCAPRTSFWPSGVRTARPDSYVTSRRWPRSRRHGQSCSTRRAHGDGSGRRTTAIDGRTRARRVGPGRRVSSPAAQGDLLAAQEVTASLTASRTEGRRDLSRGGAGSVTESTEQPGMFFEVTNGGLGSLVWSVRSAGCTSMNSGRSRTPSRSARRTTSSTDATAAGETRRAARCSDRARVSLLRSVAPSPPGAWVRSSPFGRVFPLSPRATVRSADSYAWQMTRRTSGFAESRLHSHSVRRAPCHTSNRTAQPRRGQIAR